MGTISFSEQVKAIRTTLNLSQEELAHAIGVSFATVNRWENGKTEPSKMALTLLRALYNEKNLKIPGVEL